MIGLPTFAEFYEAATGHRPYLWQDELAQRLLTDQTPGAIDVGTGLGKTSIIHAWCWALAAQLHAEVPRTVATRLHLVVDRRILVDSSADVAQRLADQLRTATDGPLSVVAGALQSRAASDGTLLAVRSLRGGTARVEHLRDPKLPAVITSTVDMLGSRLLWRGYSVSRSRRPIDAALVGMDSLVVLDEAHLSPQFVHLLDDLSLEQEHCETGFDTVPPMRSIIMTATPASTDRDVLGVDLVAEMAVNPHLAARRARRDAVTVTLEQNDITNAAIDIPDTGQAHVVFCNTVKDAIDTSKKLVTVTKGTDVEVLTLVGGMPAPLRERVLDKLAPFATGADRKAPGTIVVATQTLEVGADLDFDRGWSQIASMPALVQRLGRVNRVGAREGGSLVILPSKKSIYDDCLPAVTTFLNQVCPTTVAGLEQALAGADIDALQPETPTMITGLSYAEFNELVDTDNDITAMRVHRLLRLTDTDYTTQVVFREGINELVQAGRKAVEVYLAAAPAPRVEQWSLSPSTLATIKLTPAQLAKQPAIAGVVIGPDGQALHLDEEFTTSNRWLAGCTVYLDARDTLASKYVDGFGTDLSEQCGVNARLLVHEPVLDWDDDGQEVLEHHRATDMLVTDLSDTLALLVPHTVLEEDTGTRMSLDDHNHQVSDTASTWARIIGLPDDVVDAITFAGLHHDDGKAHPGFQAQLELVASRNGRRPVHEPSDVLLGKSALPRHLRRQGAEIARANGLPDGFRHEGLSASDLVVPEHLDRDLVTYLVATHHGHFRSLGPAAAGCSSMQDVHSEVWSSWPEVGERLRQEHGPYTIALAEAILRLADWECSATAFVKEES